MKLFIGICNSQENMPSMFFWSFTHIRSEYPVQLCRGWQPWDIGRNNYLIREFLKSDADVFIKMDIDQVYPSNYFDIFVPLVRRYKVIGPSIRDRFAPFRQLAFSSWRDGLVDFDTMDLNGVKEIPYAHSNLFITREVLEKIDPPWYEDSWDKYGIKRTKHVDFTYLDKIKDAGYPIYINLDVKVGHKKSPEYVT